MKNKQCPVREQDEPNLHATRLAVGRHIERDVLLKSCAGRHMLIRLGYARHAYART